MLRKINFTHYSIFMVIGLVILFADGLINNAQGWQDITWGWIGAVMLLIFAAGLLWLVISYFTRKR